MKEKFYKQYSFWFGIIGLISFLIGLKTTFYKPKPNLLYKIERLSNLLDVKDDGIDLKIFFKDSIEMVNDNKNISIYELEIKNTGDQDININDFDANLDFGIGLSNGVFLNNINLLNSSDSNYFADAINERSTDKIIFKKKIIDSNGFFVIKFYVLHNTLETPKIKALGKVAGQKSIEILNNLVPVVEENSDDIEKLQLVLTSLIFTLLGFLGLIYAYFKSIKNQRLIAEQKIMLENFIKEKEELSKIKKKIKGKKHI